MIRDQLPGGTVGFGVNQSSLPNQEEMEAIDPNSGVFARALEGRPFLKFLTSTVATIGGATIASSLAKGAGKNAMRRLSMKAAEDAGRGMNSSFSQRAMKSYRDTQRVLDEYGGVTQRTTNRSSVLRGGKKLEFDDPVRDVVVDDRTGFFFTKEEVNKARDLGRESAATWTYRDEMQQRLVKAGRRLPYELPAAYVTQRLITDPLLGTGPEKDVNWSNPIDVVGDFAQQTAKNLAFAFLPFEGAVGGAQHGYRKAMVDVTELGLSSTARNSAQEVMLGLNLGLQEVGQNVGDLLSNAVKVSKQSTGATAQIVTQGAMRQRGLVEYLHMTRKKMGFGDQPPTSANRTSFWEEARSKYKEINKTATEVYGGIDDSKLGRISSSLSGLSGARVRTDQLKNLSAKEKKELLMGDFVKGSFYKTSASREYKNILSKQLQARQIGADDADLFVDSLNFAVPTSARDSRDLFNRISGEKGSKIFPGDKDNITGIKEKIKPLFQERAGPIAKSLEGAMKAADEQFVGQMGTMRERLYRSYDDLHRGDIAQQAAQMLGKRKAAYGEFGANMTSANKEFLVRRSAERLGIATRASSGRMRSTSELANLMEKQGFSASDTYQMKAYLVTKGDISAPWSPSGRNLLGIRALSVQEAIDRNLVDASTDTGQEIRKISRSIAKSDFDPTILSNTKVGGMFTTASGSVINVNPITRSMKNFVNVIANETKVPLIQLQPLKMMGQGMRQTINDGPLIKIMDAKSSRRLTGAGEETTNYLWFNTGGAKGKVLGLSKNEIGMRRGKWLDGMFRPVADTNSTIQGRATRLARGEVGARASEPRSVFQSLFNVDPRQPNSAKAFFKRFRDRKSDPRNVGSFARMILDDDLPGDEQLVAEGMQTISSFFKNSSISSNAIRSLDAQRSKLAQALRTSDGQNIFEMDAKAFHRSVKAEVRDEKGLEGLTRIERDTINKARGNLLKRWSDIEDYDVLNQALPKSQTSFGLHRRIDEARMDYARYMAVKNNPLTSTKNFEQYVNGLMDEVSFLHKRGMISSREASESRIAVGSFHTSFLKMTNYDPTKGPQKNLVDVAEALKNAVAGRPGTTVDTGLRQALKDAQTFGNLGGLRGRVRQSLGTSDYNFDGFEFAPGGSGEVLVQTFGGAFKRNPLGSLLSASGATTWNSGNIATKVSSATRKIDSFTGGTFGKNFNATRFNDRITDTLSGPENFSGTSMFTANLVERMNKAIGVFGMGLDSSQYSSPLALYAKGMIGQRALPIFAAGATFMAVDRTIGGTLTPRDDNGDKVYRPFFTGIAARGAVELQALGAELTPGGMNASQKRDEILNQDVAIRSGRFWPIGNTPFKGGKIQYYRPSWYQRLQSGYQYTDQTYDTPLERLAFNYDFSPLRPLDPYRFERQTAEERPYPVSGDYFTGPWGPLTPALNATVGRLLKPRREYRENEVSAGLSTYQQVGAGAYAPFTPTVSSGDMVLPVAAQAESAALGNAPRPSGSGAVAGVLQGINDEYVRAAANVYTGGPTNPYPIAFNNPYEIVNPRTPSGLVGTGPLQTTGDISYQAGDLAYRAQEFAGIYGFAFASLRSGLGFGDADFESQRPVLASADQAYGASRAFWDLNLGGLGDVPTPLEGEYANIEISEIVRRFIPSDRQSNFINPLRNSLADEYDFLPGSDYFINFQTGDPYSKIAEGEMRLPGAGYERLHDLTRDDPYGIIDQFKILSDVAPYSNEFRSVARQVKAEAGGDPLTQDIYDEYMGRVEAAQRKREFTEYGDDAGLMGSIRHADTIFNTKFMPDRTATEDWERFNVYGTPFPQWQTPIESYIEPAINKARDRGPIAAATGMGILAGAFGATKRAKLIGGVFGAVAGFGLSAGTSIQEAITGDRYLPDDYKQQVALEENIDILKYVRAQRGFNLATAAGDNAVASQFRKQIKSTMYGADLYGGTQEELAQALPSRKREHFMQMVNAPEEERGRILSTAGRLERRIYQAAWGMNVERRPDLGEYFENNELPGPNSEIWDPRTNMDFVEIKMLQHQGIAPSELGYFPQQVAQANMVNPAYPEFGGNTSGDARAALLQLISRSNINAELSMEPTSFGRDRVDVFGGF